MNNFHEHPLNHFGQIIFFVIFFVIWTIDSYFLGASTFISKSIPFIIRVTIPILILGIVIFIFNSVISVFSKNNDSIVLITHGPFKYSRHPLYLACILFYIAISLFTISLASLGFVLIIIVFYNIIANYEEQYLLNKYANDYLDYKNKTRKWI